MKFIQYKTFPANCLQDVLAVCIRDTIIFRSELNPRLPGLEECVPYSEKEEISAKIKYACSVGRR